MASPRLAMRVGSFMLRWCNSLGTLALALSLRALVARFATLSASPSSELGQPHFSLVCRIVGWVIKDIYKSTIGARNALNLPVG